MNICPDSMPNFLGLFDLSVAPPLLFYAYVPVMILALFFGFYIFWKDRHSLQSKLLLGIAVFFFVWVFNLMFQWTIAYVNIDMFSWQVTPFFEIFIPILSIYFAYVFLNKKDIPLSMKIVFTFFIIVSAITIPTKFNTFSFDYQNCEANYGDVYYRFVYIFELLAIFIVDYLCIRKFFSTPKENIPVRKQSIILAVGSTIFLAIFYLSNILGEYTQVYEMNLFGPVGILAFICFMLFMIVRYGLFNIKLIATQALVLAISILIGSQLFFPTNITDEIINAFTLVAFLVAGFFLIRSVKREIEAKESLKIANERQAETTSLITHQIRGVFADTEAGLNAIMDGDMGVVPENLKAIINNLLKSQTDGVQEVETFLQAQRVDNGKVRYDFKPFDFKAVVSDTFTHMKPVAEGKGLGYILKITDGDYTIHGDKIYLSQVVSNLIDNAIRYTGHGSIEVSLSRSASGVIYSVKDSGIGITDEDKGRIFTKYGHGKDSRKTNAASSGLGLYIVKDIVGGHKGKIWFETEVKKGTTFFVELPVK